MRNMNRRSERGVALILSILALILLTAIAAGMMYMSTTEASVSNNFRSEENAYFAARAGVEEVRDRMYPGAAGNPYTINDMGLVNGVLTCRGGQCLVPTAPPNLGGKVLYILQNGVTMADVTNFASTNNCPKGAPGCMADDELCHDYTIGAMTQITTNTRCTTLPAGSAWYMTTPSVATYPLDYKWVRVTMKANNSVTAWPVDGNPANGAPVCWSTVVSGTPPTTSATEVAKPAVPVNCAAMQPPAYRVANPVYLITALAVSPNGARRLVQQEVAETPTSGQPGGMFATGGGCGALVLGGGANTYSFNSGLSGPTANPQPITGGIPPKPIGGDVGSNGNVDVSGNNTTVNGTTLTNDPATWGNCNQGNGVSGNGTYGTTVPPVQNIPTYPTAYTVPVPPTPNPLPPTSNCSNSKPCWDNTNTLTPGSYGNVSLTGGTTITLQGGTVATPAIYTLNSLSVNPGCSIVINGPVVLNIAGVGVQTPVDISGFANNTYLATAMVINYGGTGNVNIASANAGAFAVINAPNANVSLTGNASFYGQILGASVKDTGGATFYWDTAANVPPPFPNPLYEISMRELSY